MILVYAAIVLVVTSLMYGSFLMVQDAENRYKKRCEVKSHASNSK